MSAELDSLYQEIILDHYKNPHHTMCVNPLDVEGAFGELSGDV